MHVSPELRAAPISPSPCLRSAVESTGSLCHPHRVWLVILGLMGLLSLAAGPPVLKGSNPGSLSLEGKQLVAIAESRQVPVLSAAASILADGESGQILLSDQSDTSRPMASTTKIMTALLTLERADLREWVVVTPNALIDGSTMGLWAGEVLTVEDLLWGLLLNSANDAAIALAEHMAGSEAEFVRWMNQRAAELGLANTHFTNAHGLDAPDHYSSARDLWRLSETALGFPTFAKMVSTPAHVAAGHQLWNRNLLLGSYSGADGVKTGTSDLAGQCLVATVTRDGHRALAVVLGSEDRYQDAEALFDFYFTTYGWAAAPQLRGPMMWLRGPDRTPYRVMVPDTPELFLASWQRPFVRSQLVLADLSQGSGQPVGEVRWYLGDSLLAQAPAYLARS